MRVLVTGHLGYIGSVLTPHLVAAGHDVRGLDSGLFDACVFGPQAPRVPTVRRDIRDVEPQDVDGCDAVVHLAGLSNDPLGDLCPALTWEINHAAAVRLAEMSRRQGVRRFVFASTCSSYGAGGDEWRTEASPLDPLTPYAKAKLQAEIDIRALASDEFQPVLLRCATAFGPSPRLRFDLVLNNLVAWAATTGRIRLKSDGSAWRPLVHVDDIARVMLAALQTPADHLGAGTFNVGSNRENYRVLALAEFVRRVVPNCEVAFAEDAAPDRRCYRVDCSRLRETLPGAEPQTTALAGVQGVYDAIRQAEMTPQAFEGPRYQRLAHLQALLESNRLDDSLRWAPGVAVRAG